MPRALIKEQPKSSTQSGRARVGAWMLQFERGAPKRHDPLTGWWGSGDTLEQVNLSFPSREAAEAYARAQGLDYEVRPLSEHHIRLQAYADNFR